MSAKDVLNVLVRDQFYQNMEILFDLRKQDNFTLHRDDPINSETFNELIHYLLSILDDKQLAKKITWPIIDRKSETEFRREIVKYLNELNTLYKITNPLPIISMHNIHLTTKSDTFLNFMFLLTQFILEKIVNDPHKGMSVPNLFHPVILGLEDKDTDADMRKLNKLYTLYKMEKWELEIEKNNYLEYFDKFDEMKPKSDLKNYELFVNEVTNFQNVSSVNESMRKTNQKMENLLRLLKDKSQEIQKSIDLPKIVEENNNFLNEFTKNINDAVNQKPKKPHLSFNDHFGKLDLLKQSFEEVCADLGNLADSPSLTGSPKM